MSHLAAGFFALGQTSRRFLALPTVEAWHDQGVAGWRLYHGCWQVQMFSACSAHVQKIRARRPWGAAVLRACMTRALVPDCLSGPCGRSCTGRTSREPLQAPLTTRRSLSAPWRCAQSRPSCWATPAMQRSRLLARCGRRSLLLTAWRWAVQGAVQIPASCAGWVLRLTVRGGIRNFARLAHLRHWKPLDIIVMVCSPRPYHDTCFF